MTDDQTPTGALTELQDVSGQGGEREAARCLVGIEGCDCDNPYTFADGVVMTPSFCECHDCYVCGEIDCDGHATPPEVDPS